MEKFYLMGVRDVFFKLGSSKNGLGGDEVRARLAQYGRNELPSEDGDAWYLVVFRQFTSPLMIVLGLAAFASILVGEGSDAVVIFIAVLLNGSVGFMQEWKAEKAALALRGYEVPHATVLRDGGVVKIEAALLVPGDVVLLETGASVPADVRIIESVDLSVDEALLTGESFPVVKSVAELDGKPGIGDRVNMGFMGTVVVSGRGKGVVVASGVSTQLGKITKLVLDTGDESTPLQEQIRKFSVMLGWLFVGISLLVSVFGLLSGRGFFEMMELAIALAVASIPEGLLVAMTVILAIGMQRMLKRRALVRRLVAAETLGSVSVVCTDKTGTITRGKMSVVRAELSGDATGDELIVAGVLNNNAYVDSEGGFIGHPTETALLERAFESGVDFSDIKNRYLRIDELAFSSELKYMVTVSKHDGSEMLVVKGAPVKVFAMCDLEAGELVRLESIVKEMTDSGLRVLAFAEKIGHDLEASGALFGLRCLGVVGLEDPLREDAKDTLESMRRAHMRVVIVTGDHPATVSAIASKAGMEVSGDEILVGGDIALMSDDELKANISKYSIFARVNPEHKVRIVEAWRANGETVAMIGDGVNDAAAMKAADIGVALGSGTDVARETSDMVLLDDNLESIVSAVREGRVVFDNIQKVIVYLMSDSFSEIVLIGVSLLVGLPLPVIAVQVLWINLVTDGFPYIALTVEPGEDDVMERFPRKKDAGVVNGDMKVLIFIIGIITDIGLFGAFLYFYNTGMDIGYLRTMMFSALAMDSLFYVFSVRNLKKSIFRVNLFSNRLLLISVVAGGLLQVAVVYIPVLQRMFSTVGLSLGDWGIVLGLSLLKVLVIEITKDIRHFKSRKVNA